MVTGVLPMTVPVRKRTTLWIKDSDPDVPMIHIRRDFAATLRETGENSAFYEPISEGIPVSERLETFAADNAMASCAPPRDLTR